MKAVIQDQYGSFDQLELRELATPEIGDSQVLVRIHAAALHVGDCFAVRGSPLPIRMMTGLLTPKYGVPGFDLAGIVEAVGAKVTRFDAGDAVFGASQGTCAEYGVAGENELTLKPAAISFEQAAALPTSGLAALHAVRDVFGLETGQKILINGAAGGVGHFAVQLANFYGAQVTGVCSSRNIDTVRALGAAQAIDYTCEDFADGGQRFDFIFDNVENRSLADCRRALGAQGTLLLNSGTGAKGFKMFARLVKPLLLSPFLKQNLKRYLSVPNYQDLAILGELCANGKLRPLIDRACTLSEVPEALAHIEGGHVRGKIVVSIPS